MKTYSTRRKALSIQFLHWIKRIGFWGFLFFLVKGLFWIVLTYWLM